MKGYSSGAAPSSKRRWKGQAATVLALVFFSLLVPLAFLLGLHNRFPSGYFNEDRSPSEPSWVTFEHEEDVEQETPQVDPNTKVEDLMQKFAPSLTEDIAKNQTRKEVSNTHLKTDDEVHDEGPKQTTIPDLHDADSGPRGAPKMQTPASKPEPLPAPNISNHGIDGKINTTDVSTGNEVKSLISNVDEVKRYCQLEFGSYCLWSKTHKQVMKDTIVKRLKDQLFVARSYYPSIAKLPSQEQLSRELKQNIQDHERMLSEAISDPDLPKLVMKKIEKMDQAIARAKSCNVDCNNVDKKLRQILDLTEDEAHFHMKQSAFLYHLGVQTIPKSLHCLSMRLTVAYFKSQATDAELDSEKFNNPSFRHYVIFSRNILASSVAINSTVTNSKETKNMVFHLLTDVENYYATKLWFTRNSYREAAIHVLNFDELYNMNDPYNLGTQLTLSEEFRISLHNTEQETSAQMRTEYISVFGHSHFLLPDIFRNLKKVVVLDDDVVVQKDLSSLWNLDLQGKVVGAVEFCGIRLHQLKTHLHGNNYTGSSCVWMSGLNVIDLENWRQQNVTGIYQQLNDKLENTTEGASWRTAALQASLLVFQDLIHPLDPSWALSGLGYNYNFDNSVFKDVAVLHYNGNMKPWLDLGIPKYKWYWRKYLTRGERFMDECNVNP